MAQKFISEELRRTKEANKVVPLDEVRTYDYGHVTIASGAFPTSGILFAVASGKEAYLKQIIVTELSGNAGTFQIADGTAAVITPPLKLIGNQEREINTVLGPVTSGFHVASGAPIAGEITAVVQIDPKANE